MNFELIKSIHVNNKSGQRNSRRLFLKKILVGTSIPLLIPISASAGVFSEAVDFIRRNLGKGAGVGARAIPWVGVGIVAHDIGKLLFELYEEMNPTVTLENDTEETKTGALGAKLVHTDSTKKGEVEFEGSIEVNLPPHSENTYELSGISSSETGEFDLIIIAGEETVTIHVTVV